MRAGETPTYRAAWLPTLVMVSFTVAMFVVIAVRSRQEDESFAL